MKTGLKYYLLILLYGLVSSLTLFWVWLLLPDSGLVGTPHTAQALPETILLTGTMTASLYLPAITAVESVYLPLVAHNPTFLKPYPPTDAVEQSPNVYLQWEPTTNAPTFVHYALYLEANNPQPSALLASGLTKASFDPATFTLDTQYYWQVVATDEQGNQLAGPVWKFKVEPLYNPPQIGAVVPVPAGEFLMGCVPKLSVGGCVVGKNTPLHPVYLDAYAIDKYEVTNQQYRACVNAGVCRRPLYSTSQTRSFYFNNPDYNEYPVVFVAQEDARTYCQWAGGRLPTEAEWEKAARGPIDTRSWPWGEEMIDCARANYTNDRVSSSPMCVGDTNRVGSYPTGASPYGAMDMSGNVFEWVQDRLDVIYDLHYYATSPYSNPPGPQPRREVREGPFYVIRGGSYRPRWSYGRVFHRHHGHRGGYSKLGVDVPLYRNDQVGFRCVYPLPKPTIGE